MRRALHWLLFSMLLGSVWLSPVWGASYTFTTLDVPNALGINNAGQIVGSTFDGTRVHGFVLSGGSLTLLDVPGSVSTTARGINDAGQIVGTFEDASLRNHGFLFSGGTFTLLDAPDSFATFATDINTAGEIVGIFDDASRRRHGFVFSGGSFTPLDIPGSIYTLAFGINDAGQIVGQFASSSDQGFVISGGSFTPLNVPGSVSTIALGINNAGETVGQFTNDFHFQDGHGFVFSRGSFTLLDPPGSLLTAAHGINDAGQIVGTFEDPNGTFRGFLATPVVDTMPPAITVFANPTTLWPPNGKLVPVTVSGTVRDEAGGSGVDANAGTAVTDEYGSVQPSGPVTVAADGRYTFTVYLQASRHGSDKNGRQYSITVSAQDNAGNTWAATTDVIVPHDQGGR
jgi:probable HAF family extracellular repeat protein